MTGPLVDLTIAVHSATRPIARAVASVVDHTHAPIRINVVAHNIDPEAIRANLGDYADDQRVRLLPYIDDIPSPAGPMNHGFANSTAPFLSLLGSDDELAPGAIDSWLALQAHTGAEVVLARISLANGRTDPYPPVRRGARTHRLDGVKDRLSYRSAPLGLIDRRRFGELRLTEGIPSGEDLAYSLTLWFTARSLAYDLNGPAYIINGDAGDRVTYAPRPLAQDFAFLDAVESLPWFASVGAQARTAVVSKLIRLHFFDAIAARVTEQKDLETTRSELLEVLNRLERIAPGAERCLSRADHAALDELRDADGSAAALLHALDMRHRYLSLPTLLTRNPLHALHRQGPFRTLFAGYRIQKRSDRGAL